MSTVWIYSDTSKQVAEGVRYAEAFDRLKDEDDPEGVVEYA